MIHPLLALFDATTDNAIEKFSVTIGGAAAACWYIKQLFSRKQPKPGNEQLETGRRELERRVSAAEGEIVKLREGQDHERALTEESARKRSAGIYIKMDELRKELSEKVDGLRDEVTQQFKDTERALGRIEGKLG